MQSCLQSRLVQLLVETLSPVLAVLCSVMGEVHVPACCEGFLLRLRAVNNKMYGGKFMSESV